MNRQETKDQVTEGMRERREGRQQVDMTVTEEMHEEKRDEDDEREKKKR